MFALAQESVLGSRRNGRSSAADTQLRVDHARRSATLFEVQPELPWTVASGTPLTGNTQGRGNHVGKCLVIDLLSDACIAGERGAERDSSSCRRAAPGRVSVALPKT